MFNILLIGNETVGKTSIITRYLQNNFFVEMPTQQIERRETLLDLKHKGTQAQIVDSPGQLKLRNLLIPEYKQAKAVILVYDISDLQSFIDIQEWYQEIINHNPTIQYWILVGNKIDLKDQRKVGIEEAKKFSQHIGGRFIESSAKQPININVIFITIQQWSQLNIIPKLVPENTQKLLSRLHQEQENNYKSFESSKQIRKKSLEASFDEQFGSMEEYFNHANSKIDIQSQKLADQLCKQSVDQITNHPQFKINQNKQNLQKDKRQSKQEEDLKIKEMNKRLKHMDKLRKEISQHLILVYEQKKSLRVDQLQESTQATLIERELSKRLKSVERQIDILKADIILTQKPGRFVTNKNNFINLDESITLKQQISELYDISHLKEFQEHHQKLIQERKSLEKKREQRYKRKVDKLELEQKKQIEIKQQEYDQKHQQKKEQLRERIQSMEKIRNEKQEIFKQQNKSLKQIQSTQTLHQKLEMTFKNTQESKQIQEQQIKLQELKKLYQPIRLPEIKEWEQNYVKAKKSKQEQRYEKAVERNKINFRPSYISSIHQEIKYENQQIQIEKERQQQEVLHRQQALLEYSLKLKEQVPSFSQEKHEELEKLQTKFHHLPNYQEYIEMSKNVKSKGVFFKRDGSILERSIDEEYYQRLLESQNNRSEQDRKELGQKYLDQSKKLFRKPCSQQSDYTTKSSPDIKERNPKLTKLLEIKQKWKLKRQKDFKEKDLESILNEENLYGMKKNEFIDEANRLAQQAIRSQQIIAAKGTSNDSLTEMQNADSILINSIKAKLKILNKNL